MGECKWCGRRYQKGAGDGYCSVKCKKDGFLENPNEETKSELKGCYRQIQGFIIFVFLILAVWYGCSKDEDISHQESEDSVLEFNEQNEIEFSENNSYEDSKDDSYQIEESENQDYSNNYETDDFDDTEFLKQDDESVIIQDDVASEITENEEPEEKLTLYEEQVLKVEKMLRTGYSVSYIAKKSSFSKSEIRRIKKSLKQ